MRSVPAFVTLAFVAILLALPQAALAQQSGVDLLVHPLPVTTRFRPADQFQAVARLTPFVSDHPVTEIAEVELVELNDEPFIEHVRGVALGVDTNGDGHWTAGEDQMLLGPARLPAGEEHAVPGGVALLRHGSPRDTSGAWWSSAASGIPIVTIAGDQPAELFVLYRLSPDTPLDVRFQTRIGGTTWKYFAADRQDPKAFRNVRESAPFPAFGFHGMALTPRPVIDPVVTGGDSDRPIARVRLDSLDRRTFFPDELRLTLVAGVPAHIVGVRLLLDANGNGEPDAGERLIAGVPGGLTNGRSVTIDGLSIVRVGRDGPVDLLVVADFAESLPYGAEYALRVDGLVLAAPADASVFNVPRDCPGVTGYPATDPAVHVSTAAPAPVDPKPGDTDAVVGGLIRVDAIDAPAIVHAVRLVIDGEARAGLHVTSIALFNDVNANGQLDALDRMAGGSPLVEGMDALDLVIAEPVVTGGRLQLLVAWMVAGDAPPIDLDASIEVVAISTGAPVFGLPAALPPTPIGALPADDEHDAVEPPSPLRAGAPGCNAGTPSPGATWLLASFVLAIVRRHFRCS